MGMYPSLIGTFNISTPILTIGSSLGSDFSSLSSIPFCVSHLEDPWTLLSPSTSDEGPRPTKMDISLSVAVISYQAILDLIVDHIPSSSWIKEEDPFSVPAWAVASLHS